MAYQGHIVCIHTIPYCLCTFYFHSTQKVSLRLRHFSILFFISSKFDGHRKLKQLTRSKTSTSLLITGICLKCRSCFMYFSILMLASTGRSIAASMISMYDHSAFSASNTSTAEATDVTVKCLKWKKKYWLVTFVQNAEEMIDLHIYVTRYVRTLITAWCQ